MTDDRDEIWDRVYEPVTGRAMHYRLIGQTPVPCSLGEWATSVSTADRRVRLTYVGPYEVSTVFLGLDHNFSGNGPAILFETMTFLRRDLAPGLHGDLGGSDVQAMDDRYATWEEAERGHQRAVDYLRAESGEEPEEITGPQASTESTREASSQS